MPITSTLWLVTDAASEISNWYVPTPNCTAELAAVFVVQLTKQESTFFGLGSILRPVIVTAPPPVPAAPLPAAPVEPLALPALPELPPRLEPPEPVTPPAPVAPPTPAGPAPPVDDPPAPTLPAVA